MGWQFSASDATGGTPTYSISGQPPGLSMNSSGVLSGTIASDADTDSPYLVTFTATDGPYSDTQKFYWYVSSSSANPVVELSNPSTQANADGDSVSLQVSADDASGGTLSYSLSGQPPGLSIDPNSGLISGTIPWTADTNSPYFVTVTATDGPYSDSQVFPWYVSYLNPVKVTNPGTQSSADGQTVNLQVSTSDATGGTLSYSLSGQPPGLSITSSGLVTGTIPWTADTTSPYLVTVAATDGPFTVSQEFVWYVSYADDVPLTDPGNRFNYDSDVVSLPVSANDTTGAALSYTLSGQPPGLSINSSGQISGNIAWTANTASPYLVTVTAADGPFTVSQEFVWYVSYADDVPLTDPGNRFSYDSDVVSLPVSASDTTGAALSYTLSGQPPGLSIDPNSGLISGTVAAGDDVDSPYAVTVSATDSVNSSFHTSQNFWWYISLAPATVLVSDSGGPYDGTPYPASASVAGLNGVAGPSLEGQGLTLDYQQFVGGSWFDLGPTAPSAAGSYQVTASFPGSPDYAPAQDTVAFTITPAPLTVFGLSADDKVYDGTTTASLNSAGATLVGVFGSDDVTLDSSAATASFAAKDVGTNLTVTVSGLALSGPQAADYTLTPPTLSADITPASLTVSAMANTKPYDDTTAAAATPAISAGSVAGGDTPNFSESYTTKDVGSGLTLVPLGVVNDGDGGADYAVSFVNAGSGVITPAALTVAGFSADDKVYDGSTAATLNTAGAVLVGVLSGDNVTLDSSAASGTFATKDVGSGLAVTVSGLTLDGAQAADYTLTPPTLSANITPAPITVSAVANTKPYDGTTAAATTPAISAGSVAGGDTPNFSESYTTKDVGSGLSLVPSGAVNDSNGGADYAVTFVNANSGVITLAALTASGVSADDKVYDGTTAATLNSVGAFLVGVFGSDDVTLDSSAATGTFVTPNVATGITVTVSGLALSGPQASDYTLAQPTTSADITAAIPLVTVSAPPSGTYNGNLFAATATIAGLSGSPGPTLESVGLSFDYQQLDDFGNVVTDLGPNAPSAAGTYQVWVTFPGSADYAFTSVSAIFTIAQAAPTVTSADASGPYTGSAYNAAATVAGINGVPGATLESVGLDLDYLQLDGAGAVLADLGANAPSVVGNYWVTANFPGSPDYLNAHEGTAFFIGLAQPVVSVTDAGGPYTGNPYPATDTVAGQNSIPGASLEGVTPTLDYKEVDTGGDVIADLGSSAPSAAGLYEAVATFGGSVNYPQAIGSVFFAITAAISGPTVFAPPVVGLVPLLDNADASPLATATGADGGNPAANDYSSFTPVRYADGSVFLTASELSSDGFGMPWGQTVTWSSRPGYATQNLVGNGTSIAELPYLVQDGNTIIAVIGANAHYFNKQSDGTYEAQAFLQETLTHDNNAGTFTLADSTGDLFTFFDFGNAVAAKQGAFASFTDPAGHVIQANRDANGTLTSVTRTDNTVTEEYAYSYVATGANAGLLANVSLQRQQVPNGPWTVVQQVAYTYYNAGDANGNAHDLKLAQIEDGSGNVLQTWYYTYYTSNTPQGQSNALQYVFDPEAYARLLTYVAAGNHLPWTQAELEQQAQSLTGSAIAPYATYYFAYDNLGRVTKVLTQSPTATAGGAPKLDTYTYSYQASGLGGSDPNTWQMRTTETLPDGTQNIVYTNAYGEVMLDVSLTPATGQQWLDYYRYDAQGRLILQANPSAVEGYSESYAGLITDSAGNYVYISADAGLLEGWDYYASGSTTGPAGYLQDSWLAQGSAGTHILQGSASYSVEVALGITIHPVATATVYANEDGSGAETTLYAYAWANQSLLPTAVTVTYADASSDVTYNDAYGRAIWYQDAAGYISYTAYDQGTGAVVKTIQDVNTAASSNFQDLPAGWSSPTSNPLNLTTLDVVDGLGRTTKETDPNGIVTYTVYNDPQYEVSIYAGWDSSTNQPTGAFQVVKGTPGLGKVETWTVASSFVLAVGGQPTGNDSVSTPESYSYTLSNGAGLVTTAVSEASSSPLVWYTTTTAYNFRGEATRVLSATGTITRTVYDGLGRPVSTWVGLNDAGWSDSSPGGGDMVEVSANVYDNGGIGDSNLTQTTQFPGGGAAPQVSQFYFDWRDRQVASKSGAQASENDGTNRPIVYTTYDNLDEVTKVQQYDGDGVSLSTSNGVPQAPAANLLRAQTVSIYNSMGEVIQTLVNNVDQSTGALGNDLVTSTYYDARGLVIAQSNPGGLWNKYVYDGAGRVVAAYVSDGAGGVPASVAADNVLQEADTIYDNDGNSLEVITRQRFDDNTNLGPLGTPSQQPYARVSYVAYYYDLANRLTATVDVGTNGGVAWTRPAAPPTGSNTVLVTRTIYDVANGLPRVQNVDPKGNVTATYYDMLGRVSMTVSNGISISPSVQVTRYPYDGDNNVVLVQNSGSGGNQATKYVYQARISTGSTVDSNDVLTQVCYPDPNTGNPSPTLTDTYTVNALGQNITYRDRNGTVHAYTYDVLARLTDDTVTTFGPNVDQTVARLHSDYNAQGLAYQFTSYGPSGNVVNQVLDVYNGLGQLTTESQAHAGAVAANTPSVVYVYDDSGNYSRLQSITYPNGRILSYDYDQYGRPVSIADGSDPTQNILEQDTYLGLDTLVQRVFPQAQIMMTLIQQPGDANARPDDGTGGGDKYTGLDRFGRVIDDYWMNIATGATTDRWQYWYDADSNVVVSKNLTPGGAAYSQVYGYDNFNQLSSFQRGTLSSTNNSIPNPTLSVSWNQNALGDATAVTTNNAVQTRTSNQQNQLTAINGVAVQYNADGSVQVDQNNRVYTYDAWGHLVLVQQYSSNNPAVQVAAYQYDALGRRIVEVTGPTASATTVNVYVNASGQDIEEQNANGQAVRQYVWSPAGGNLLVEYNQAPPGSAGNVNSARYYVQQDPMGSVTAIVSSGGMVLRQYIYNAFGQPTALDKAYVPVSLSWVDPGYLFQGQRYAGGTGFYQMGPRDLDPVTGRWIEPDPTGQGGGDLDLYRYANSNPGNYSDPSGLDWVFPWDPRSDGNSHLGEAALDLTLLVGDLFSPLMGNPLRAGYETFIQPEEGANWWGLLHLIPGATLNIHVYNSYQAYRGEGRNAAEAAGLSFGFHTPVVSTILRIAELGFSESLQPGERGRPLNWWDHTWRWGSVAADCVLFVAVGGKLLDGPGAVAPVAEAPQVRPLAPDTQIRPPAAQTQVRPPVAQTNGGGPAPATGGGNGGSGQTGGGTVFGRTGGVDATGPEYTPVQPSPGPGWEPQAGDIVGPIPGAPNTWISRELWERQHPGRPYPY